VEAAAIAKKAAAPGRSDDLAERGHAVLQRHGRSSGPWTDRGRRRQDAAAAPRRQASRRALQGFEPPPQWYLDGFSCTI
jgi:hypothetical protein